MEMLYSQIPQSLLENIAGKLTIDLKFIKTEFSESPKEKSLHSKLLIIESYLKEKKQVGSLEYPSSYIADTMSMKMGSYSSGLVYFGGCGDVVLGLGGSKVNVIGNSGDGHASSHSATPYLVAALNEEIELVNAPLRGGNKNSESVALSGVELATSQMEGVIQKMEFFAKILLRHPSDEYEYTWAGRSGKPVLLGSPLYVSIVD